MKIMITILFSSFLSIHLSANVVRSGQKTKEQVTPSVKPLKPKPISESFTTATQDNPESSTTNETPSLTSTTEVITEQGTLPDRSIFSELAMNYRLLNENEQTVSKNFAGSVLLGYDISNWIGLSNTHVTLRYVPTFIAHSAITGINHEVYLGGGYSFYLKDFLSLVGRVELGAGIPNFDKSSTNVAVPTKLDEIGFVSQLGLGVRYFFTHEGFKRKLAIGADIQLNSGTYAGVSFGPIVSLYL